MSRARVVICYPCHDRVHAGFCNDLAHLIGSFAGQNQGPIPGFDEYPSIAVNNCQTSILPDGRQKLVEFSKKHDSTHILWLDSDMRFPKETLHLLLGHGKKIVGANYISRRPPYRYTAATLDNKELATTPQTTGIVRVGHIGFGVLLTDISVFEGDGPWFAFDWHRDRETKAWKPIGEDVFFCRQAIEAGHEIWCDHDLSNAVGHIGEWTYSTQEMAEAIREAQEVSAREAA